MGARFRRWLPLIKLAVTLVILAFVAWFFVRVLGSDELRAAEPGRTPAEILWDRFRVARPVETAAAAGLYLLGLGVWGLLWLGLLRAAGEAPPWAAGLRAYYLSHLGKYTPGMGVPLVLRTAMAAAAGVRPGTAALTAAYETLTTMAAGALLAAVLFTFQAAADPTLFWKALGLLAVAGVPLIPGVFNFLVRRSSARFTAGRPLPRLPAAALPAGLAWAVLGWGLLGASLAAVVAALREAPTPFDAREWLACTAVAAVAFVAGWLSQTPGGLGVRELVLQQFLAPRLGDPARAVVAVVLLRLLWTAAEVAAAGVLFWLPSQGTGNRVQGTADKKPETTNAAREGGGESQAWSGQRSGP
jgi:uncharacterized membrane protein YbhN (UPF0104 family)